MTALIKIMVVEDEIILAEDLRQTLENLGYHVVATSDNADEACELIALRRPDLVMMDIHIHGSMDGVAAATRVRNQFGIPVIFLTAHSDHATLQNAKRATPYGYLLKPFSEQELRAAIETALFRHKSDMQLQQMERWLRTTLNCIGDAVIAVDQTQRINFLNPMAEQLSGWSRQEALGRSYEEVYRLARADDQRLVKSPISTVLETGEPIHFDEGYKLQTASGRFIDIDDSISPIRNDDNEIVGAVIIFRDCSEKLELERRRRDDEARQQESKRLESLGMLAGGIAHDFNNLLAIILGYSELLPENEQCTVPAAQIKQACLRAAHLCEQMLAYGDNRTPICEQVNLKELITKTRTLLRDQIPEIDIEARLPEQACFTVAHAGKLQQLVSNLVLNSAESLTQKNGRITIDITHVDRLPDVLRIKPDNVSGPWLKLSVIDNGKGIPAHHQQRIFDPFFSTKFTGRGLGLSVVYSVVKAHDAGLALISESDVGTTFEIYLRHHQVSPKSGALSDEAPTWSFPAETRILVVEDEPLLGGVISLCLRSLGASTDYISDPLTVEDIMTAAFPPYSGVFLDLTMPDLSGTDLLKKIRARNPSMPVVLMSGYTNAQISDVLDSDSSTIFIPKPFTIDGLQTALRSFWPALPKPK